MDKESVINEIRDNVKLVNNDKIIAIYLFGSVADGINNTLSDIDVCVIGEDLKSDEMAKIHCELGGNYDVSFFEEMPIWIKMRILKGVVVVVNDVNRLYDVSFRTLAEYEDFRYLLNGRIMRRFGKCMI